MTAHVPVRFLLLALYAAAVLAGAFGTSYAIFEWRDDDGGPQTEVTANTIEERLNSVASDLQERLGRCHAEASRLMRLATQVLTGRISSSAFERELRVLGGHVRV